MYEFFSKYTMNFLFVSLQLRKLISNSLLPQQKYTNYAFLRNHTNLLRLHPQSCTNLLSVSLKNHGSMTNNLLNSVIFTFQHCIHSIEFNTLQYIYLRWFPLRKYRICLQKDRELKAIIRNDQVIIIGYFVLL